VEHPIFWRFKSKIQIISINDAKLPAKAYLLKSSTQQYRLLALSYDIDPPALTIVIGKLSPSMPSGITTEFIAFEGCGDPSILRFGEITPEYELDENDHKSE
jgi:hypothetical protein